MSRIRNVLLAALAAVLLAGAGALPAHAYERWDATSDGYDHSLYYNVSTSGQSVQLLSWCVEDPSWNAPGDPGDAYVKYDYRSSTSDPWYKAGGWWTVEQPDGRKCSEFRDSMWRKRDLIRAITATESGGYHYVTWRF